MEENSEILTTLKKAHEKLSAIGCDYYVDHFDTSIVARVIDKDKEKS